MPIRPTPERETHGEKIRQEVVEGQTGFEIGWGMRLIEVCADVP